MAGLEGLGVTITDACTPKGSLTVSASDAVAGVCPTVVTRTYTVKDACQNLSALIFDGTAGE